MPESCVSSQVAGQNVSCGFKFLSDEAQAKEPSSHRVFGVFVLLGLGTCGSDFLCHLAECEAKLNVALQLTCVDAASAFCGGGVKLEKSELDRSLGEGGVEIQHVVAAAVVMLISAVIFVLASVPDVGKLCHGGGLLAVDFCEEAGVDRPAVVCEAAAVQFHGIGEELLMACHDVCEVSQALGCVPVGSDVDVDSAAPCGVTLGSGVPKLSAKFLQGFDVAVLEDRGDQFALFVVWALNGNVLLEFPFSAGLVPCAPGVVAVPSCGVLVASGTEEVSCQSCGGASGNAVHFNLDADGLLLHFFDLVSGLFVHGVCLL